MKKTLTGALVIGLLAAPTAVFATQDTHQGYEPKTVIICYKGETHEIKKHQLRYYLEKGATEGECPKEEPPVTPPVTETPRVDPPVTPTVVETPPPVIINGQGFEGK
jgi:hypothetical protein